ncbi:MAG: chemotaxis protein CheW [Solirubrobacterales bacterium]
MDESPGLIELTGGETALDQANLIRLVECPEVAPIPDPDGAWVGVANLRGEVIPVTDLGILSGSDPIERPVMAAIRAGGKTFGLLIQGIERTVEATVEGDLPDEPEPGDPTWLLPTPPGRPRVIDPELLLEDPRLGSGT